jgi:XTP/dITP diphosphohydrolase
MPTTATLVVATSNRGKLEEIRTLLVGTAIELLRPVDVLGHAVDVVEDGETFEANAEIKARAVGRATGQLALADDSGLEVDVLGGLPGVRSARFAGDGANDQDNNAELLRRLAGCREPIITARFRCAMALYDPAVDSVDIVSGACEGAITLSPRGTLGFGYDPLFLVAEIENRTMAELSTVEKNIVSHRGKALRAMLPRILRTG